MIENEDKPEERNESETSMPSPIFDIDLDKAVEYIDYLKRYPRTRQICICGHTATSHKFGTIVGYTCKPNNQYCPCRAIFPVYLAGNASCFKRSSHGPGMKHALTLGIAAMKKSGATGEWLVDLKCMYPGCSNVEVLPAPVNKDRRVLDRPSSINVMICRMHVIELGGDLIW